MNRIILGLAALAFAGAANAACFSILCINPGGQVQIGPKIHGNWQPYNGGSIVVEVPGETVTNTVEKEKVVERKARSSGNSVGASMAALVAANFFAAMCQDTKGRQFTGELVTINQVDEGGNPTSYTYRDEKNELVDFVCTRGDLPDPFESYAQ